MPSCAMSSSWLPISAISPSFITTMRSALRMVDRRCAITSEVRPRRIVFSACWIRRSECVSMFAVASSRMRMRGSAMIARANAMSWR